MRSLLVLLSTMACLAACGPEFPDDLAYLGHPIINGTADTSQAHMAVVAIYEQRLGALCSGTLIAPTVVMTAGHCAYGSSASNFIIYFCNNINSGSCQTRRVSEVYVHPRYDGGNGYDPPVNDLALLRLSSAAPATVTPIPFLPRSLNITSADIGQPLEFVGFGVQEDGYTTGVKMTVTNALNWVCTSAGGCSYSGYVTAAQNTICQDQSPGGPCSGDSGGPAFITRGGTQYVCGITSYGDQNCEYYGCSTKVDAFETEIANFVGGVNGAPCTNNTDCDSGFCVGGVCCENACTAACNACNQAGFLGTCRAVANGLSCADGDRCNGDETCLMGNCTPGTPPNCTGVPCQSGSCDPALGCVWTNLADGTSCADTVLCNGVEVCQNGACVVGNPNPCDDHNFCTVDSCDEAAGCGHTNAADGTLCGGGVCGDASCRSGACEFEGENPCDDDNPCTVDWCDAQSGCAHTAQPEGWECGECAFCVAGTCSGAVEDCPAESCGCGSDGAGGGESLVALLVLLFLRRRRG